MNINRLVKGVNNRTQRYINERRGWKTKRNIVVIESDDWGSIRMPNKEVHIKMLNSGLRVDKCNYCTFDSLASTEDFQDLYHTLFKHKDTNGRNPTITANSVMANPNFEKIRNNGFREYYYESFIKTIDRYPNHSFKSWQEGIDSNLFFPQFHGREHLNIDRWMTLLQRGSKEVHNAFNNGFFGISKTISNENNPSFMAALDIDNEFLQKSINVSISEGLKMFQNVFEFNSKSFIAPNYVWNGSIEKTLAENGVQFLQGGIVQKVPKNHLKYNFLGKKNRYDQMYLCRNVLFEPSMLIQKDWVDSSLLEIDKAFKLNKPAIICSHRVNFIGSVFVENRTKNLNLLDQLLTRILKKWPNVEFMNTVELGNLIKNRE